MSIAAASPVKPVHPVTARDLLRCCHRGRQALQEAEEAIRRGNIPAVAQYSAYIKAGGDRQSDGRTPINDRFWRRIVEAKQKERFWKKGSVHLPKAGKSPEIELTGIYIEPLPLIAHLERYGLAVSVDDTGQIVPPSSVRVISSAGRNAYAHGVPIATVALELSRKSEKELRALKATALVPRLRQLYIDLGVPAPTERSLEGFAGGILSVVRAPDRLLNLSA